MKAKTIAALILLSGSQWVLAQEGVPPLTTDAAAGTTTSDILGTATTAGPGLDVTSTGTGSDSTTAPSTTGADSSTETSIVTTEGEGSVPSFPTTTATATNTDEDDDPFGIGTTTTRTPRGKFSTTHGNLTTPSTNGPNYVQTFFSTVNPVLPTPTPESVVLVSPDRTLGLQRQVYLGYNSPIQAPFINNLRDAIQIAKSDLYPESDTRCLAYSRSNAETYLMDANGWTDSSVLVCHNDVSIRIGNRRWGRDVQVFCHAAIHIAEELVEQLELRYLPQQANKTTTVKPPKNTPASDSDDSDSDIGSWGSGDGDDFSDSGDKTMWEWKEKGISIPKLTKLERTVDGWMYTLGAVSFWGGDTSWDIRVGWEKEGGCKRLNATSEALEAYYVGTQTIEDWIEQNPQEGADLNPPGDDHQDGGSGDDDNQDGGSDDDFAKRLRARGLGKRSLDRNPVQMADAGASGFFKRAYMSFF